MRRPRSPDEAAWSSAMIATALATFGMAFEGVIGRAVPGIALWTAVVPGLASASLFVVLWLLRSKPNRRLAAIVFVVNAACLSFAMFMRDPLYARVPHWVPFQEAKLACIAAALLAPGIWSAFAGIGVHLASTLLVVATLDPRVRATIAFEPTGSIAFAIVGGVIAFHRQRRLALERDVTAAYADVRAADRLARTILAVRDLANTPIQTIELCSELLRLQGTQAPPSVYDRLARATERLRALSRLLLEYEEAMDWQSADTALDAEAVLTEGADEARRTISAPTERLSHA
ncbi:MAG: hypothetical protein ACXVEF_10075 [Polyangiales bacterium]